MAISWANDGAHSSPNESIRRSRRSEIRILRFKRECDLQAAQLVREIV